MSTEDDTTLAADARTMSTMSASTSRLAGKTVLVSGASGMIGSRLVARLRELGAHVVALTTSPSAAVERGSAVLWDPERREAEGFLSPLPEGDGRAISAVVHLGGHPIAPVWTAALQRRVYDSRVGGARVLARWLAAAPPAQGRRVLVTASGVGVYAVKPADYAGPALAEADALAGPHQGLLDRVGRDSESACDPVRGAVRVCHARFGVVLDRTGGVLARLVAPYRLCLGGPMGSGRQAFPWVSGEDAVEAIVFMLENEALAGAFNVVSPGAENTSQKRFSDALGRALRRPAVLPTPGFLLRAVLGKQAADAMLLGSIKVKPAALLDAGFAFKHTEIESYLERHFNSS